MKKLLYPICVCVLLLTSCAKKATPDRMMCDCLDRGTADYLSNHPNLSADDISDAKTTIATPCATELQKAYSEAEQKEFDKLYTKQEQRSMEEAMELCGKNLDVTLQKAADKSSAATSHETVKGVQDTLGGDMFAELPADKAADRAEASADKAADRAEASADCDEFLAHYEEYANSYAALATKYAKNPMDMTIMQEYTEMADKAQKMEQDKPDACEADGAFRKRYLRITAKVTKATAAQAAGSAKMLESMSK